MPATKLRNGGLYPRLAGNRRYLTRNDGTVPSCDGELEGKWDAGHLFDASLPSSSDLTRRTDLWTARPNPPSTCR